MRHMTLAEWDVVVAPILGVIQIRCGQVVADLKQIQQWLEQIPAVPEFETMAAEGLEMINEELKEANEFLQKALATYESKEKVS